MQPAAGRAPVQAELKARRFRLASPATATVLGALVFVLTVIAIPLASLTVINTGSDLLNLAFAGVGVVVARRQPRNPIGWILLDLHPRWPCSAMRRRLRRAGLPPTATRACRSARWPCCWHRWAPSRSRRFPWSSCCSRTAANVAAVAVGALGLRVLVAFCRDGHLRLDDRRGRQCQDPPRLLRKSTTTPTIAPGWIGVLPVPVLLIWLSFVGHQVLSWRRATDERRQQLKWLACGAADQPGLVRRGGRAWLDEHPGAGSVQRDRGAAGQHRRRDPEVPAV